MGNRRQEERSTGTRVGRLGQRRWVRRLAWLVALLFAVAASVVALSRRAESFEPQHYHPSPELAAALALKPDTAHGEVLYQRNCANCHAKYAWGSLDGRTPAIAGQHYQYLVKQIADLRSAEDRSSAEFHQGIATVLDGTQAIADVASYLAESTANPSSRAGAGDQLRLGGELYESLCRDCHQDTGAGFSFLFIPSIAGQHYPYLLGQLEEFARGHRRNAPSEMLDLASTLSSREMAAIADYVARLPQPK